MAWVLAVLGAFLGVFAAEVDESFLGFATGALIGALLGQAHTLRARSRGLEERLARLEAAGRRVPATAAGADAPAPVATPALPAEPQTPPAAAPPPIPARPSAEPPPPDAVERLLALARGWLFEGNVPVKIGVLVLMFGVAAALKYAAEAGWLTMPVEFRLAGIAAGAIAGLVWGLRRAPVQPAFGLSLQGGAIGILLLVVFAAFRYYGVLPAGAAFGLVIVLVAGASVLAVRQNAPALAVLGFIGGYLAPVLISTGSGNHVALFSYYAVLNAAVFAIAWRRPWRALNLVGFAFTFAIAGLWGAEYYRPDLFATVEPFLVLFFAFYVAIPVLYALVGRERNGKVDGTLLFGTPLLAFPMQMALLEDERLPLAASAVIVAAVYAGLAAWAVRNPRLRALAQSTASLGVVFATLAIPLALEAQWTSAAWALQALGMVWLGLRQGRALTRWAGLALLVLAAGAWAVHAINAAFGPTRELRFLLNGDALNLLLLALAWAGAGWLHDRGGRHRVLPALLMLAGLGWWVLGGLIEIFERLDPLSPPAALAGFAAVTAAVAGALRAWLPWPRLGWAVAAAAWSLPLLAVSGFERWGAHWAQPERAAWWPALLVALAALAALRVLPRSRLLPSAHIAVLLALAWGAGQTGARWLAVEHGAGAGWQWLALLAPLGALAWLTQARPRLGAWPVAVEFPGWRRPWLGIAGAALLVGGGLAQFSAGSAAPLAWWPLLNPLELATALSLLAGLVALRAWPPLRPAASVLWSGALVFALTFAVLRALHHLAGIPWGPDALGEPLAQAGLTITWCLAGVVAWVRGSRARDWPLWVASAVLIGGVVLKLVFVDRQYFGNLTGIVSLFAVGLLLLVLGRVAPHPPRQESH